LSVQYTLKQNQTLERVASDVLGKSQEGWFDVAIENKLTEEDYSMEGGNNIELKFSNVNQGVEINSVVDVMIGKSIYGKDVYRKIQIENEDLKVLNNDETILQAVDILINLKKEDNPDSPNSGLQSAIIIGSNRASLNFPIIERQLTETFNTDDSLQNFSLKELRIDQDSALVDYEVQTRLNETYDGQVSI